MKASTLSPTNAVQYSQLLREYGLPLTGLLTSTKCFEFRDDQSTVVGFAGLQQVGVHALLRSLVVFPARQKAGFGSAIVTWTMSFASSNRISRLFALTTNSQPFFRKYGFQTIDRATVPQSFRGLSEFCESCCSSAYVMKRDLIRTA